MRPSLVTAAVGMPASAAKSRVFLQLREAEVEHLHAVRRGVEHDVGRLQIAMRDPALMRGADRVGQRDGQVEHAIERQPFGRDHLLERLTVDELEREKRHAVRFLDGMDRDDVRMIERGRGARLALEALAAIGIERKLAREHFERDVPLQPGVVGEIDLAHAAGAK